MTPSQKKQAALLYDFSSLEYLDGLAKQVRAMRSIAESILDTSRAEGRDRKLRNKR